MELLSMLMFPSWDQWGIQHSKETYGPDADMFRPERWLEASDEQLQRMERAHELIFNYGRFQCLGRNVAFMELNKIFVEACDS